MKKYKLGELIEQRREKNPGGGLPICGVTKEGFIPPKQQDADTSIYNVFYMNDFVFNPARMELNSIVFNDVYEKAICSSLYEIFFVKRTDIVLPAYLGLWVKRDTFTRYCEFLGSGSAREYCRVANISEMDIELPDLETQERLVKEFVIIKERIKIKKKINDNLLDTLATHFNNLFFTEASENKMQLSEIINFGNGKARPNEDGIYPVYGGNGILSYTSKTNAKNVVLIGRVGAYCGSTFIEEGDCWVSDNAIVAKSIIVEDEYFDYFLLKKLDLYNHHVGTGQQLLTQGILNSLEVPRFNMDDIKAFNSNAKNVFKNINLNKQEINHLQDMLALILSKLSN